jgi:hypothetical protein
MNEKKEKNSFFQHISVNFEDEQHHEMIDYDKLQRLIREISKEMYCLFGLKLFTNFLYLFLCALCLSF